MEKQCTWLSTGNWNCDAYDRFFIGLPAALQAARALTIISLFFNLIGMCASIVGLDCTTVAADQPGTKHKCIMAAGVFVGLSGLCIGIAVSWFAANVLYDYHNPLNGSPYVGTGARGSYSMSNNGDRYVYGECLFLGWVAMIVSILTGVLFCCNSYNSMNEDPEEVGFHQGYQAPLTYNAPKSMGHEYI